MSMFALVILFDHFQFALIHGPNIQVPMKHCPSFYQTLNPSPDTSTTRCCLHFVSISSFFLELLHSSAVAYWAPTDLGSSSFTVTSFFPFHTVYGVLKARILPWFDIPFSRGPHFVRTFHHDTTVLGGPTGYGS